MDFLPISCQEIQVHLKGVYCYRLDDLAQHERKYSTKPKHQHIGDRCRIGRVLFVFKTVQVDIFFRLRLANTLMPDTSLK